jgi:hypothetical protein
MKKIILILSIFVFSKNITIGKENIIYLANNNLCFSIRNNTYTLWEVDPTDTLSDAIVIPEDLSAGYVSSNDSMIICYDTIRLRDETFKFKKLDEYRIQVINDPPFFESGDILYASVISDSIGRPVQYLYWKDGKRDGSWEYYLDKGIKFVLYKDGNVVEEYFKTYKEYYKQP